MYKKWLKILSQVELFKDMDDTEILSVIGCIHPKISNYNKSETITIEQEPLDGIGIILEGEVIICKETVSGDKAIISKLDDGDLFGEVAAFSTGKWPATVIANTDCVILFFPQSNIVGICHKACSYHKKLIQNMLFIVSRKALVLNKKVEILSLKSIRKKISMYLIEQHKLNKSYIFEIPLNRNELADYLLVTRPSLSREIINMKKEGIIDFHNNSFKILDLETLKNCL